MKKLNILIAILMLSVISFSFAQDTERYTIKLLDECNDELSNFGTTFYGDNQVIYSSPKEGMQIVKNKWKPNNQPFLELFLADMNEDGELVNRKSISRDVNSKFHESNVAFTNDTSTVYFSRDKYYDKKLDKDEAGMTHIAMYRADVVSPTEWTNIIEMPFNNKDYCVGHPTLSEDDKTLYFSSELDGSDDIYKVIINDDGTYGLPEKLGSQVNTDADENFPFMGENNTLYFSSNRKGGNGKLDIYSVKLNGRDEAKNLGMPINSIGDDFSFTKKRGDNYGYFSSNRMQGKGDDDIYYFKELEGLPCTQFAEGIVTDKKSGKKIPYAFVTLLDADGDEVETYIVGRSATFSFEVDCSSKYKVVATKEKYSEDSKEFISNANLELGLDLGLTIEKELVPSTSVVVSNNTPYVPAIDYYSDCQQKLDNLDDIYFDLNESNITYQSAKELDKVIRILYKCPNIRIMASSHTDCRSSHDYNQRLSQRRAQATINYIIKYGGIDGNRLNAVGYGETRLVNRCADGVKCTEAEHQMNRRTQFEITNY